MLFFKKKKIVKKRKHEIPAKCIYDPYADLESKIVGEVERIIKNDKKGEKKDGQV